MSQEKQEEPWPAITKEERILHEILFYSQGPVDGYILGDEIRNLLLKSGLSLTVLSQIWNLADVTNDNVLNVHEFVLIMHLIRGVMKGRAVPKTLPRGLTPPKTAPQNPNPMTQQEKDAYLRVFQTLDYNRAGFIDVQVAAEMFLATGLPIEVLAQVWDLSDFNRDGKLNPEKFAIACHLLRYVKQSGSLDGPVDIFQYAPQHISPLSLLARKRRVSEYEEHKQRLMSLKERRKIQAVREARRLDLCKQKVEYLQQLNELLTKVNKGSETDKDIANTILKDVADNTKQEEIALRLKREHEKVRQETVKIILGEQKFNSDISIIKKDTDELNKRLLSIFTHATKDPDPFHKLYEQRREKRQGSTIKDLDKIDIYIPFEFSPFDLNVRPETLPSGNKIFDRGSNHKQPVADVKSVIEDLKEFGEGFMDIWGEASSSSTETTKEFEDDEIFREVHDWSDDNWPNWDWTEDGLLGVTDPQVVALKQKLLGVRDELQKLSGEGSRLVFRNADDYYARKKALEEEEKAEKGRVQRRSVTERFRNSGTGSPRVRDTTNRYSYAGERRTGVDSREATQAAREYRLRRRSQNFDSAVSSPEILGNLDRERRLYRASTDPASVSDEASLSRESSLSSIDQASSLRGSSQIHEEESSTIRTHHSSRTDDSGVSTFRSHRRKDDSCSESSSVALIGFGSSDSTVTATFLENAKCLEADTGVSQTTEPQSKGFSSASGDQKQEEKERTDLASSVTRDAKKSTSPETSRRSLKNQRASDLPASVAPLWDKSKESYSGPFSEKISYEERLHLTSSTSSASENLQKEVSSQEPAVSETRIFHSHKPPSADKTSEESTQIPETENSPKRPPRLKKRSVTSEGFSESSTNADVTTAVESAFSVTETSRNRTQLSGNNTTESKSKTFGRGTEVVRRKSQLELSSKTGPSKITREEAVVGHTSNNSNNNAHQTDVSDLRLSSDQSSLENIKIETSLDIKKTKKDERTLHNKTTPVDLKDSEFLDTVTNVEKLTANKAHTQSETISKESLTSVATVAQECSSVTMAHLTQSSGEKSPTYDVVPDDPSDSDIESGPPPLPDTAPPPLPAGLPPATNISVETVEEVVTVEYTMPVAYIAGGSHITELQEHQNSISHSTEADKVSHASSLEFTTSRDSHHSTNNEAETDKESPSMSKATSDLRSDFFGLKPRNSSKDTFSADVPKTLMNRSCDTAQVKVLPSKKFNTSDASDTDSGDRTSHGDDPLSPGDDSYTATNNTTTAGDNERSGRSSEKRSLLSNDSIESTFEDSLSVSSSSSVKLSPRPQHLSDNGPGGPTKQSLNRLHQEMKSPLRSENPVISSASTGSLPVDSGKNVSAPSGKSVHGQKTVSKKEGKMEVRGEILQPHLPELERERRTAISQSVVKRKIISALATSIDSDEASEESVQNGGKSLKSSNPSEYGFVYSADRPVPLPEAGWTDRQGEDHKVNLYSENVVKEGSTTETINRESIADLATTKRQWETIFTSHSSNQGDTSVKKKASPRWSVRLPYTEKPSAVATNQGEQITEEANTLLSNKDEGSDMFKKPVITESAIEREIRLAHEREEMLRREKEERQKLAEKQAVQAHQSQTFIASYTTSSSESESCQPAYNELAEADRDPGLWAMERNKVKEEKIEESVGNSEGTNPNESIIEREIRLQREREAEVARMRKQMFGAHQPPQQQEHTEHYYSQYEEQEDVNHNKTKVMLREESTPSSSQTAESLIAKELQELKDREEEIKRLHISLHGKNRNEVHEQENIQKVEASPASSQRSSQLGTPINQASWQRDVSPFLSQPRRESVDSASSHSTGRSPSDSIPTRRDVRVRPIADGHTESEDQKPDYFQKQETPIEREMRLARERENELRKQKGLPELNHEEENPYSSYSANPDSQNTGSLSRPRSLGQPDDTMKKFASSRLQQELQQQKERELALLSEGKIMTTSEEHIQPLNFMDVATNNNIEGALKRNFVTRKTVTSYSEPESPQGQQERLSPAGQSVRKPGAIGAGGQLFSYREFKQSAESKIERELREMKEREEELRKQRTSCATEPAR